MKATLRDELHIRLWIAPNRTAESREIAALPAVDDALPCAPPPAVHLGARQLILTDVEDRRNIIGISMKNGNRSAKGTFSHVRIRPD